MRIQPEQFLTNSLRASSHGETITRVLAAAINAVDPEIAIEKSLQRQANHLVINGKSYKLDAIDRVLVIAFGKASLPMAQATAEILGDKISAGIIITKSQTSKFDFQHSALTTFEASHPVPDQRGVEGANQIIELLKTTTERDLVLCLISGGGSALLTAPAEGITLDNIQQLNRSLLASGANIGEINTLRKHLSKVKGGSLAKLAFPAQVISLILSDVIGDPLDVIASGPTVPDTSSFADAQAIIAYYGIAGQLPVAIHEHLEQGHTGKIADTPKPGDAVFEKVHNTIIGNIYQAAKAALVEAQLLGLNPLLLTTNLEGEASTIGPALVAIAKQIDTTGDPIRRPACLIAGGETTVTIQGDGLGGRNQELALSTVHPLAGLKETILVALATDGDDGPTDAAGAVVTGQTLEQALLQELNPAQFLSNNNAYHFFEPLGDLLKPGPTLTNVNDLNFIFCL